MKHTTLVIMAAGLGSRFGGNKQVSCVGPNGEWLMEYSIHDAVEAGFDRIVFVLKEDMIETVREKIGNFLSKKVSVEYAVQDSTSLPSFYHLPAERTKPLGTVHALLCAAPYLDGPFATVNADDYYGKEAYRLLHRMLGALRDETEAAMVPYILGNTMSENGGVTRGICTLKNGCLQSVRETKNIHYAADRSIESDFGPCDPSSSVSMNIWGFHPDFVPVMQDYFETFLRGLAPDELKAECLLPIMVNDLLEEKKLSVAAENSPDRWFGLTYKEDVETVRAELARLHKTGFYPKTL